MTNRIILARLVALFLVLLCLAPTCIADAIDAERLTPALTLAILSASEAGWEPDGEVVALHHVLLRGAARRMETGRETPRQAYIAFARRYASRLLGDDPRPIQRPWLRDLQVPRRGHAAEPASWPTEYWRRRGDVLVRRDHAPWRAFEGRWVALYAHAARVVELPLETWQSWSPCQVPPDHWGCEDCGDHERAVRAGFIEVDCGVTSNEFWRVPARDELATDRD